MKAQRTGDMHPTALLRITVQDDGDVVVAVDGVDPCTGNPAYATVEFCSPGQGGGKKPKDRGGTEIVGAGDEGGCAMNCVAVLFARRDSIYKSIPGTDVFDADRDALRWPGGTPVVAHPPCRAWGQLRHMANPRDGEKELAIFAIDQVRRFGGVLEHPKNSSLWPFFGIQDAPRRDAFGGWTLPINQSWWGHRAEKATRLYVVGCEPSDVPTIPLVLGDAPCVCGTPGAYKGRRLRRGDPGWRPEITKAEREHTPKALAQWLVELARRCEK